MKTSKHFFSLIVALTWCVSAIAQYNYGEVLQKSILFYETQQSGKLPSWNRISWRTDAGENDGQDVGLDLSGGWFDAGDHIKFGLPMAFSATALNWGYIEYKDGYEAVNQGLHFKRNMKWVTDYFIKCHSAPNEFYAQVSAKNPDHNFWVPAEMADEKYERLSYKLDEAHPGSDLAGESAATLASASMVFADSDPSYSATLLQHAKELFSFADNFRGRYTDEGGIPAVGTYSSGGYIDELCWAALWLYKATNDDTYLDKAKEFYEELPNQTQSEFKSYKWSIVWDDKSYGCYVLMAEITDEQQYKDDAERHLDWWTDGFDGDQVGYSPGGLAWLFQWGSLRHTMNASLTALIYSDKVNTTAAKKQKYRDFAKDQLHYILGDNPSNRSYVTGFGNNPPTKPHHRGQHSSWIRSESIPVESRHTLWGALVGGPGIADDYEDDRGDFQKNEVACDYNACFQGVAARMVQEFGGTELPNFPQPETPGIEFLSEVRLNSGQRTFTEVAVWMNNRSGWPARIPNKMAFRYFFDITEGIDAGFTIDDYTANVTSGEGTASDIKVWDEANNIYYVEVTRTSDMPFPAGQESYRRETQMRVSLPSTAPAGAWDSGNDFSAQGLSGNLIDSEFVPIYVDDELVWGQEPAGGNCSGNEPVAAITASTLSGFGPLTVDFDASSSTSPDNGTLSYSWSFGDGTTANTVAPGHTFDVGVYTVTLTVENSEGCSDNSSVTINVEQDTRGIFVSLVGPDNGKLFQVGKKIRFKAEATSSFGDIVRVAFFANGDRIKVDKKEPYIYPWLNAPLGDYELTARATDSEGNTALSAPVSVSVVSTVPPTVSITSPTDGETVVSGTSVTVTASAEDGDGIINNVALLLNGTVIARGNAAPYSFVIDNPPVGEHVLIARAVDNDRNRTLSEAITITVQDLPDCAFGAPLATALPTIGNTIYKNIFVLGNGPDLSNITEININWNLENDGLYQFSALTNDGVPNWFNDLKGNATHSFSSEQPELNLSGTDLMDGSYYVTKDGDNFAMVSKTGNYTIYCSTTASAPDCNSSRTARRGVLESNGRIVLFPNPSADEFSLEIDTDMSVTSVIVTDEIGKTVFESQLGRNQVETIYFGDTFEPGIYLVQVVLDDTVKTYKVMKK